MVLNVMRRIVINFLIYKYDRNFAFYSIHSDRIAASHKSHDASLAKYENDLSGRTICTSINPITIDFADDI